MIDVVDWETVEKQIVDLNARTIIDAHASGGERDDIVIKELVGATTLTQIQTLLGTISSEKVEPPVFSLLMLTYILYLTEGVLSFCVNTTIYVLMLKGHHDIWNESERKFVTIFDDLFKIRLDDRLKFLNLHGLKFFSQICPRTIRNAIAHFNFLIEGNGYVNIRGTRYSPDQLKQKILDIVRLVELFMKHIRAG